MTTCFGLRDHHQAIVAKILKTMCSAVQTKLVISGHIQHNKVYIKQHKINVLVTLRPIFMSKFFVKVQNY